MSRQSTLFEADRLTMAEAVEVTVESLRAHGAQHPHWGIAWSGGKDSSATLTLIVHLLESGRIEAPRRLTVFYADTRQELPPLAIAARQIGKRLAGYGIDLRTVMAPLDKRFLVYILGRGVPPPNNTTLRWCTRQIKVDPMSAEVERLIGDTGDTALMITGLRIGESVVRDARIAASCGRDGGECGQGWYQQVLPNAAGVRGRVATLAPLLHWRVCHVWDWLMFHAPSHEVGGWPTRMIADAYGGDEAEEINARTGCIGCPLASREKALDTILTLPAWSHLAPLKGMKPLYRELREPRHRLRQPGGETRADGSLTKNQQRLGPLTFSARLMGLERVLDIQAACNRVGRALGREPIDLLNAEEEARIRELIAAETWPHGWEGDEPTGDVPLDKMFADGSVQPLLRVGAIEGAEGDGGDQLLPG